MASRDASPQAMWMTGMPSAPDPADESAPAHSRDLTQKFELIKRQYRGGKAKKRVEEGAPPLGWVQAVYKVEHAEDRINSLLKELGQAQQEHIRASNDFGDESAGVAEEEEMRARELTAEILGLFKQLDVAIHRVVRDPDDTTMLSNVQRGLAARVNTLHTRFQAQNDKYEQQRKRFARRVEKTQAKSDEYRQWEQQDERDIQQGQLAVKGFSAAQIETMMFDAQIARERAKDLENIEERVTEINVMFKDLNALVVDQGTMLDMIENNISRARETVKQGTAELKVARQHQKKCILQ
eukprot:Hpha_TRINITY_DN22942_c0_g1::TRINITY_DN22942_c0_g1_i1::g.154065::m.154065/K08489/STX16; syntaxin 16